MIAFTSSLCLENCEHMLDFARYSAKMPKGASSSYCAYCGTSNSIYGSFTICGKCEGLTSESKLSTKGSDYVQALLSIRSHMNKQEYDESIKEYDALFNATKEPMLLYAEALACIEYSNYVVSKVSYDKPGFMESNSMLKHNASDLVSKAKLLLAKCASMLRLELMSDKTPMNMYNLFITYLKFGDLAAAHDAMLALKNLDSSLYEYASMLIDAETNNIDSMLEHAEKLIKANWQPHAVLYYAAYALFKKKHIKESKIILKNISSIIKSSSAEQLEWHVEHV